MPTLSLRRVALPLLLLPLAFAAPAASGDRVGRVITQTGEVAAIGPDGERRELSRRDPVFEGDTLVTGKPGRAQIRFEDEGLTHLRPDTRFEIEQYRSGEEGGDEEKNVLTRLVEGGLRTITGAVGREDEDNYRMDTPVASIGIRGTQYELNYCQQECAGNDPGLYGGVAEGGIRVSNQGGTASFAEGQYFHVASPSKPPRDLATPPAGVLERSPGKGPGDAQGGQKGEPGKGRGRGRDKAPEGKGFDRGPMNPGSGQGPMGQGQSPELQGGGLEAGEDLAPGLEKKTRD